MLGLGVQTRMLPSIIRTSGFECSTGSTVPRGGGKSSYLHTVYRGVNSNIPPYLSRMLIFMFIPPLY